MNIKQIKKEDTFKISSIGYEKKSKKTKNINLIKL